MAGAASSGGARVNGDERDQGALRFHGSAIGPAELYSPDIPVRCRTSRATQLELARCDGRAGGVAKLAATVVDAEPGTVAGFGFGSGQAPDRFKNTM